MRYTIDDDLVD